jgi:heptosyltransferase-2
VLSRRFDSALVSPRTAVAVAEPIFQFLGRRSGSAVDIREAKNVLVVRLDEIGDVVLLTPFLRELRHNLPPAARVSLIVKPGTRNLVETCPYVDEVLTFDWSTCSPLQEVRLHARALQFARQHLWKQDFDLAIVPRWDTDYYHANFIAYFSGAASRIGYSERISEARQEWNRGGDRLLTTALVDRTPKHEVEHNLDVLRSLGAKIADTHLELWLTREDEGFAEHVLGDSSEGRRLVAFGIGAGVGQRRWPIGRFAEVGTRLCQEMPTRIVIIGSAEDIPAANRLRCELGDTAIDVTGKATLRQTAAVTKKCGLFIGNDAGPMHIAAAVGVPVIEICCQYRDGPELHPNSPARFRPWTREAIVLQPMEARDACRETCEAGEAHCILGVTVSEVGRAVDEICNANPAT